MINKDTKGMKIFLGIFFIILILLLLPIKIKGKINFNVLDNVGYITGKFFFIRVLFFKFYFIGSTLMLVNKRYKVHPFDLRGVESPSAFSDIFVIQLLRLFHFNTIKLYATVGDADNAFNTAMLCSMITIPVNSLLAYIKVKKPLTKINAGVFPSFCANSFIAGGASCITFNLLGFIYCFIKSLTIFICGGLKNGKRASN